MADITSFSNNKCKYIRSLAQRKARLEYGEYIVEGVKAVRDAFDARAEVSAIYISESFRARADFDYPAKVPVYTVSDSVFERMCDTRTPQGILAAVKLDDRRFTPGLSAYYVYCDGISDPGNLGTIIRTADAAGFDAVLLSENCADAYAPKTVRAGMGSHFHVDVYTGVGASDLVQMKKDGFMLVGGDIGGGTADYREPDYAKPLVIAVGNEANGISEEILGICRRVKIPIYGRAESLNAAVAASILMYEAARQRS